MKKFRKGDKIALKSNYGYKYIVTRKGEDGVWHGTVAPDHVDYNGLFPPKREAYLGNKPKNWRLVERAQSEKDKRTAELVAAVKRSEESFHEQRGKQEVVDYDRDLEMLQAGWVSIERLRRNTLADVTKSYDGRSPFMIVEMRLKQNAQPNLDGSYIGAVVQKLTRQG